MAKYAGRSEGCSDEHANMVSTRSTAYVKDHCRKVKKNASAATKAGAKCKGPPGNTRFNKKRTTMKTHVAAHRRENEKIKKK